MRSSKESFQSGFTHLLGAAVFAVVFALSSNGAGGLLDDIQDPPPPKCDGQVMYSGSECAPVTRVPGSGGVSYGTQQAGDQIGRGVQLLIVGAVAIVSGLGAAFGVLAGIFMLAKGTIEASRGFFRPHRKGPMSHS